MLIQKYDTKNGTEEGNGYLDLEELTALVKDLNFKNIKKRTIKYFMKQLDTNGDKKISFEGKIFWPNGVPNKEAIYMLYFYLITEFKAMNRTKLMKKWEQLYRKVEIIIDIFLVLNLIINFKSLQTIKHNLLIFY